MSWRRLLHLAVAVALAATWEVSANPIAARGTVTAFGKVIDSEQRPLKNAVVTLRATDESGRNPRPDDRPSSQDGVFLAVSDTAGRFEIVELPAGGLDLTVRRKGFAPLTVRGIELPPGNAVVDLGTVILAPEAVIRGLVTDLRERPIAGAEVWVAEDLERPRALLTAIRQRLTDPDAVADEAGRFVIEDLPPGRTVQLICDRPGYLPVALLHEAVLDSPGTEPLKVILRPAVRIRGRVLDEHEHPIAGAEVNLTGHAGSPTPLGGRSRAAVSDDRGAFVLTDVAPGSVRISAFAQGFQPSPEIEIEASGTLEIEGLKLVLARGGTVEGWLTDLGGEPVSGARVRLGRPAATSGAEGFYRVDGVPPGLQTLHVDHHDYNRLVEKIEVEPGVHRADFVLAGGYRITGGVVDEDELPVPGAGVELRHDDVRQARHYRATTDAEGSFSWPRVAGGGYSLRVEKRGFVPAYGVHGVQVVAGPAEDLVVVLRRGASIVGRIVGLDFEDLSRVKVLASCDEHPKQTGQVDYAGRYEVTDLGEGDWTVKASLTSGSRQAQARVLLDGGVAEVRRDLEFGLGLTLTGQALLGPEPIAGANVSLAGHSVTDQRAVRTDLEGRFRIEDLHPGRYRLGLSHRQQAVIHNQDLELFDDRDLRIELATASLSGRVISTTSEPLPDTLVLLKQLLGSGGGGEGSLFTAGTDLQGSFDLERLTAGRYRLTVRKNGYEPAERIVDLTAGARFEGLEIVVSPTPGLDLVVRTALGQVPRWINVQAVDNSGRPVVAETRVADDRGRVHVATLPPGSWNLLISAPSSALTHLVATVPGEPVEVALPAAGQLRVRVPTLVESRDIATLAVTAQDGRSFLQLAAGGELRSEWPVTAGHAIVPGVPAGLWAVRVTGHDGQAWVGSVATTGEPDIELVLE